MKCEYGCGQEAKYKFKNGKWCCSKKFSQCPNYRKKKSISLKREHREGKRSYSQLDGKREWNKGLTKETDERVAKGAETYIKRYNAGEIKHPLKGKHLSKEHRESISKGRIKNLEESSNSGFVKTKYYKIYCPYIEDYVNVQGTWEFKYAEYLNKQNIKWVHSRKYILKYFNKIERHYFPDFYLPDLDEYHEVKGWFMNSDKEKMKYVIQYNRDKKIRILQKKQLERLGIDLNSCVESDVHRNRNIKKEKIKILKHTITWIHDKATVLKLGNFNNNLIIERRELLDKSGIDLTKYGWVDKVSKLWNCSHTQVKRYMNKYLKEYEVYRRKTQI